MLDLNLPKMDGRELLSELKQDQELRKIPVVIVTTSDSHEDIDKAYYLHANGYVTKPVEIKEFFKAVKSIDDFWCATAKLPTKPR